MTVDSDDVSQWFGEYLDAFAACGRGERDTDSLLAYYGVPLLFTTDGGFFAAASGDQVVDRTEIISSQVTVLNATSALYYGTFSRLASDGGEIGWLTATYLVTDGPAGRRISALLVHSLANRPFPQRSATGHSTRKVVTTAAPGAGPPGPLRPDL